jgi:microcin C transport system ATP-binding protein
MISEDSLSESALLEVKNLSITFGSNAEANLVVDKVSFTVHKGETLAIVGESGSGKSVTALSVVRLLSSTSARYPSGKVLFNGIDLLQTDEKTLRSIRGNEITFIFQEPMTSLNPLHTVGRQIGEVLILHGMTDQRSINKKVIELLSEVGISDPDSRINSYPHELSGGQRQRVMIAMALANRPKLLIADEPTTALDVTVQAQILNLLKDLQRRYGMSIIFITHDLGIVRRIADDVCVMKNGKVVESGKVEEVFLTPTHDYTKMLLGAEPKGAAPRHDESAPCILKGENIRVWFPIKKGLLRRTAGFIKAVDDVSLTLREGQTLGVVGESGSGKTTLGMSLLRLKRSEGRIFYHDQRIDNLSVAGMRPYRRLIQVVFQDPFGSLSPRMSVADIIGEGLQIQKPELSSAARREIVAQAMADTGLNPCFMDRYPHEFSGGQRQRICIARALALDPKVIVLDEPTSALDMSVQAQIVDLLRDIQRKKNLSYLFISHDLKVVKALASELIIMRQGKIVERGRAEDLFSAPQHEYTKSLFAAAFNMEAVNSTQQ